MGRKNKEKTQHPTTDRMRAKWLTLWAIGLAGKGLNQKVKIGPVTDELMILRVIGLAQDTAPTCQTPSNTKKYPALHNL